MVQQRQSLINVGFFLLIVGTDQEVTVAGNNHFVSQYL